MPSVDNFLLNFICNTHAKLQWFFLHLKISIHVSKDILIRFADGFMVTYINLLTQEKRALMLGTLFPADIDSGCRIKVIFTSFSISIFILVHFFNLFVHSESLGSSIFRSFCYVDGTIENCFQVVDIHERLSVQDLMFILIANNSQKHGTDQCLHRYYRNNPVHRHINIRLVRILLNSS